METRINYKGRTWKADLDQPLEIGIPIRQMDNPNCYGSPVPEFNPVQQGDFIGSIAKGGPVNHYTLKVTPHGNGTHTECLSHIMDTGGLTIGQCLKKFHFIACLISVNSEQGKPLSKADIVSALGDHRPEALIIRTMPNDDKKLTANYSGTGPAFLDSDAAKWIRSIGVNHLLIDLPSVDPEVDGGRLAAHKAFWNIPENPKTEATITELVYIPQQIIDGIYLLNLQVLNLEADASPSRPVLYNLES